MPICPTDLSSGDASDNCSLLNGTSYDGICPDNGIAANRYTLQHHGVLSDPGEGSNSNRATTNERFPSAMAIQHGEPMLDIPDRDVCTEKDIVFNLHRDGRRNTATLHHHRAIAYTDSPRLRFGRGANRVETTPGSYEHVVANENVIRVGD
jgi:hypothetical protein